MEEILIPIFVIIGGILVYIPSQRLKTRDRTHRMEPKAFWQLILMYLAGSGLIAAAFIIGGM